MTPSLHTGGEEKQLVHLALGLNRARFDPVVWCPLGEGLLWRLLRGGGVETIRQPFRRQSCDTVDAAIRTLRDCGAGILYSFAGNLSWVDTVLAATAEIPIRITRRVNMRYWDRRGRLSAGERVRSADTTHVVANCRAVAQRAMAAEALAARRITIIPNGVPVAADPVPRGGGRMVVGYVANYRSMKGHSQLLRAFRGVAARFPDAELLLVGRPHAELLGLIEKGGLRDRVTLTGEMVDVEPAYRKMSLYVQPSLSEGLSCALVEAMAHGLPVVATDTGGTAEVVRHGVDGLIVPPGDTGALRGAMAELMGNERMRVRMGAAAWQRAARYYSVERFVARHERLFTDLLDAHHSLQRRR